MGGDLVEMGMRRQEMTASNPFSFLNARETFREQEGTRGVRR